MKIFSYAVKYVLAPLGTIASLILGAQAWMKTTAGDVVAPMQVELREHIKTADVTENYIKSSLERLERESIMMRSNQDKTNDLLIRISQQK